MSFCNWYYKKVINSKGDLIIVEINNLPSAKMSNLFSEQKDAEFRIYEKNIELFTKIVKNNIREWPTCKYGGKVKLDVQLYQNKLTGIWICNCNNHDPDDMPF